MEIQADGGAIPSALLERPIQTHEGAEIIDHFRILNNGRQMGFSAPNPLTANDILIYRNLRGLDFKEWEFLHLIQSLDKVYLIEALKKTNESD